MNYPDAINFKELLPICWLNILDNDIVHQTQDSLNLKLRESKLNGKHIYPNNYIDLFKVFQLCSPDKIKVVILGMDPYHSNPMQANGIAFSVSNNKPPPLSLIHI
jgi:uracil-DNA glycosylase